MWDCIRDLKTCELQLNEGLNGLERDWLIGCLVARRGVSEACYRGEGARLIIEYDADLTNRTRLLDFLYVCGVSAEPAPVRLRRRSVPAAM
jgi:hypothetical protein